MSLMDRFRNWARGYSQADIDSAVEKLEKHWSLPSGSIIAMSGREMMAIQGEGLMQLFWHVRNLDFVNHPDKRQCERNE